MRPMVWALVAWTMGSFLSDSIQTAHSAETSPFAPGISVQEIPQTYQERASTILSRPSFHVRGPSESFTCNPGIYHWLLDNPHKAAKAWQKLGAPCADIEGVEPGHCAWKDDRGSEVHWYSIIRTAQRRVWYVEGSVRPGRLLPRVPVKALVILHVQHKKQTQDRAELRHQGELYLHTSSRALRLATRILGSSGPRMAKDYIGQIETFFGAMSTYLTDHPEAWKQNFTAGGE